MELEPYIEPEREVIGKREENKLLSDLRRTHEGSLKAAEDILRYVRERKLESPARWLLKILEDLKPYENLKERARKLKNEATIMIKEMRLLDKRSLPIIIHRVDSQEVLKDVIKTYLKENENIPIPSDILRDAILTIKSWELKETLARRLLEQNPNTDDLSVIEEELEDLEKFPEGSPSQLEALEKHWEIGMSTEDFTSLTWSVSSMAERNWERGKREGMIEKLSIEQINEIFRYTEILKVKTEVREGLLSRLGEELERLRETLKRNPKNTEIKYRLWDLEKIEKGVKKENERMELYTAPTT